MGSGIKLAAEKLMKIASELEMEASVNTYFVCDRCNHTASLSEINSRRKVAAEKSKIEHIAAITVNDIITCVACGGKMAYVPTEDSEKYYIEAEEDDLGDDIFEPVNEGEETKETDVLEENPSESPEAPMESPEGTPEETPMETPEEAPEETPAEIPEDKEEIKTEDTEEISEGLPESDEPPALEDKTDEDISVEEETVPEDTGEVSEEGISEEISPEDISTEESDEEETNGVNLPKKDVPKFEKIPKEAQLGFWKAVAKYSL